MNTPNITPAIAAAKPCEREQAGNRPDDKNWKPYPCLLTRRELQQLVAEQLG